MNIELLPVKIETHIRISDPDSGEVFVEGSNAIHRENMSLALAEALSHGFSSYISEIHFGCGAAIIASDGTITYRTPNVTGADADLHTPTYYKVIDELDFNKTGETVDNVAVDHVMGAEYADTVVTATLDYTEPDTVDTASGKNLVSITNNMYPGEFEFNEIGLKTKGTAGLNSGNLLTHFIFHPVQKNINKRIQIVYTLRVRAG
jgi:hypothetical protein